MRKFINIVSESVEVDRTRQAEIEKIIEDGLENYSGVDYGSASNAAYDILIYGDEITPERVLEIVKDVDSYDPYEGFELHTIQGVAHDICQLLGIA
jgi:hypothetical protein